MIGYAPSTTPCYSIASSPCYAPTYDDPCLYVIYQEQQNFFWSLHVVKLAVNPSLSMPFSFVAKRNIGIELQITSYTTGNFGTGDIRGIACDSDNLLIFYADAADYNPPRNDFPTIGQYDSGMNLVRRIGVVATPQIALDSGVRCAVPDNVGGTANTPYMQFHKFFPGTGLPDSYYPEIYTANILNEPAIGSGVGFDLIAPTYEVVANPTVLGVNRSHGALLGDGSVIYGTRAGLRAMIPRSNATSGNPILQPSRPQFPARAATGGNGIRLYSFAVTTLTQTGYGDSSIEVRDLKNNVYASIDGDSAVRNLLQVTPGFYRVLFIGGI